MSKPPITATVSAWLSSASGDRALEGSAQAVTRMVSLYEPLVCDGETRNDAMRRWQSLGYTYVGEADITLRLIDDKAEAANKIESLRAEKNRLLTDASTIEADIQKLLAIEYTPAEPTP